MKTVCCPNCGAPVHSRQRECEYCGSVFDVPETEQIIMYADNEPVMIVERINDFITRDEARRMYGID